MVQLVVKNYLGYEQFNLFFLEEYWLNFVMAGIVVKQVIDVVMVVVLELKQEVKSVQESLLLLHQKLH